MRGKFILVLVACAVNLPIMYPRVRCPTANDLIPSTLKIIDDLLRIALRFAELLAVHALTILDFYKANEGRRRLIMTYGSLCN